MYIDYILNQSKERAKHCENKFIQYLFYLCSLHSQLPSSSKRLKMSNFSLKKNKFRSIDLTTRLRFLKCLKCEFLKDYVNIFSIKSCRYNFRNRNFHILIFNSVLYNSNNNNSNNSNSNNSNSNNNDNNNNNNNSNTNNINNELH